MVTRTTVKFQPTFSVAVLVAFFVVILTAPGILVHYYIHGDLNVIFTLLILFFAVNLLICYWEICLFYCRDYIEIRADYWGELCSNTGRTPAREFFTSKVPISKVLAPTIWADVWATYSQYDDSYADRRTFGFNADIANGFVTLIPTLILYIAFTINMLPAIITGIIGAMLFWQWTYITSTYWVSFFTANRQHKISRAELYFYIITINAYWVVCALLGLYVSIRLIVDGNYSVLGY